MHNQICPHKVLGYVRSLQSLAKVMSGISMPSGYPMPMATLVHGLKSALASSVRVIGAGIYRAISVSLPASNLSEFFPNQDKEEQGKTGRSWRASELRAKSHEDLHKLWYILLKERNMLLTLKHEARRQGEIMPSPERMRKVRKSMARIRVVLGERERAVKAIRKVERQTVLLASTEGHHSARVTSDEGT